MLEIRFIGYLFPIVPYRLGINFLLVLLNLTIILFHEIAHKTSRDTHSSMNRVLPIFKFGA